jgi:Ribonuclease G/E
MSYEIMRAVEREARGRSGMVTLITGPEVGNHLIDEEHESLDALEKRLNIQVAVDPSTSFHREQFEVRFEEAPESDEEGS